MMARGVEIDGQQLYTWCAFDPFFVAPVLGRTAKVTSSCPVTDGEGWVSGHPGTFLLSLGEAFELGRRSLGRLVDAEARR